MDVDGDVRSSESTSGGRKRGLGRDWIIAERREAAADGKMTKIQRTGRDGLDDGFGKDHDTGIRSPTEEVLVSECMIGRSETHALRM